MDKRIRNPEGRPPSVGDGKGGKRRDIYIDEESWQRAKDLGNGKASEGIRRALKMAGTGIG